MKFNILYLVIGVVFFGACNSATTREVQAGEVLISGVVENPINGVDIILERMAINGVEAVDTTTIEGDQFKFYVKEGSQAFYRINLFDKQYVTFILSGDDPEIKITADGSKATGKFTVNGSTVNDQKNKIDSIQTYYQKKFSAFEEQALNARETDDIEEFNRIRIAYFQQNSKMVNDLKGAIWNATPNLSAIYGLNYLDATAEYSFLDSVATSFKNSGKLLEYAQSIIDRVESLRKLAVGSPAPEISLPNPEGDLVSLSSLKGKYVLIDFWAAWCRPCRMENPNVKNMYEIYADKGFEILGVSLDRKRQDWVNAIEKDGLPWLHVSDLKYFNSEAARLYEIQAIPATYLIDPEGKIVAKGLRGPTLRAKLQEIFG